MTVAVKYCGGCNPRYDRAKMVDELQKQYPRITITGAGEPEPDLVLVVCGCSSRCADHSGLRGRYGKYILSSPEDFKATHKEERICQQKSYSPVPSALP